MSFVWQHLSLGLGSSGLGDLTSLSPKKSEISSNYLTVANSFDNFRYIGNFSVSVLGLLSLTFFGGNTWHMSPCYQIGLTVVQIISHSEVYDLSKEDWTCSSSDTWAMPAAQADCAAMLKITASAALSFLGYLRFKKPGVFSSCHSEKLTVLASQKHLLIRAAWKFVPHSFSPNWAKAFLGNRATTFGV